MLSDAHARIFILSVFIFSIPSYAASVTAFVSPDSSFSALRDFLHGAKNVSIATYTFTSVDVMDEIIKNGANATILVDGSPVGGLANESKAVLCELEKNGAKVYVYSGSLRYMHAKYLISEGKALVTSENIGDSGFPKNPNHGNRGWGVVVEDKGMAEQLKEIFDEDVKSSERFACGGNYTIKRHETSGKYTPIFSARTYSGDVSLMVAPNAIQPLVDMIGSANSYVLVEQFYIYRFFRKGRPNAMLESLIAAARRGVNVSVLLDSNDYNVEEDDRQSNLYTAEYINSAADTENISIVARLADLGNGIEKLHNKGLIVDDSVLVSSINWNENSPANNREVGVVIKGEAAEYFSGVFAYDFHPGSRITGNATAGSYLGFVLIPLIVAFLFWIRKRRSW